MDQAGARGFLEADNGADTEIDKTIVITNGNGQAKNGETKDEGDALGDRR